MLVTLHLDHQVGVGLLGLLRNSLTFKMFLVDVFMHADLHCVMADRDRASLHMSIVKLDSNHAQVFKLWPRFVTCHILGYKMC